MALLSPQMLGKQFKRLNTGKDKFKDLSPELKKQIAETRETARPGTQAHTYWQNINQRREALKREASGPVGSTPAQSDAEFRGVVKNYRNAETNIRNGLKHNFSNASDDVLSKQTSRIMNGMDERQIQSVGSKNGTFGQMIKTDMGGNTYDINSYVTSALGGKGWMGGSTTHHNNFDDLMSQTKARQKQRMGELRQQSERSVPAQQAEDRIRKIEYDNKQATIGHLRKQGFSGKTIDRTIERIEKDKDGLFPRDMDAAVETVYKRRGEAIAGDGASQRKIDRATEQARQEGQQKKGSGSGGGSGGASPNGTVQKYMQQRYGSMVDDVETALSSGQKLNADTIGTFSKQARMEESVSQQFKEMIEGGKNAEAIALMKEQGGNYVNSANIMDKAMAHKIPQKGAVVVGGAWLVNNMSSSKGQQSNAQLYGQQSAY